MRERERERNSRHVFLTLAILLIFTLTLAISCNVDGYKTPATPSEVLGFESGTGSKEDPFIIKTAKQFESIGNSKTALYYKLDSDIQLPANLNIEEFFGTLDGNGKTITFASGTVDIDLYQQFLFYALRGATLKNLTVELSGDKTGLVYCTEADVLLESVTMKGELVDTGNNISGFVTYLGYERMDGGDRRPSNLTLKNCINEVSFYDPSGLSWGHAPFIGGFPYPNVESESSLVLDGCINKADIIAGQVGFVFGNQSDVHKIKKVEVKNCKNEATIKGFIDAGIITYKNWNGTDSKYVEERDPEKFIIDESSKANIKVENAGSSLLKGVKLDTANNKISGIPTNVTNVGKYEIFGLYYVKMYKSEPNETQNQSYPMHATLYVKIGETENAQTSELTLDTITAADRYWAEQNKIDITGKKTGDIIELNGNKYIFIAEDTHEAGIKHSCLSENVSGIENGNHTAKADNYYISGIDKDGKVCAVGKIS